MRNVELWDATSERSGAELNRKIVCRDGTCSDLERCSNGQRVVLSRVNQLERYKGARSRDGCIERLSCARGEVGQSQF